MQEFSGIEAVILDKDGVFVNFHKLWLRMIAYRAQLIAERSAETSDALVKIRTACIRAMGIDEDDESIDPFGPSSMPKQEVRLALATALFIVQNEIDPNYKWKTAFQIVDESMQQARAELDITEMSEAIEGSVEKIKQLNELGFKLGIYTSDTTENTNPTLEKFGIKDLISAMQAGESKTQDNYKTLCSELGISPEKTLLVSDSPNDLRAAKAAGAKTLAVLSGVIAEDSNTEIVEGVSDAIIKSLADLELEGKQKVSA